MNTGIKAVACTAVALLAWAPGAFAQQSEGGEAPKWSVGVIGLAGRSPFEAEHIAQDGDEKINYQVFPYVAYRGDRFFIEGMGLGYHLLKPSEHSAFQLSLDAVASARTIGGYSRDKITADAGLRLGLAGDLGALSFTGLQDVTDTHNGTEISATYSYSFEGEKWSLTPSVGVQWQSQKLANHMWGVTADQQATLLEKGKALLPLYQVTESATNYTAGLMVNYRMSNSWSVIAFAQGTWLDKTIRANPGIDEKFDAVMGLGLAYSF